jgi:PTS system mannose-specific IID component
MAKRRLDIWTLVRVLWRSFYLQATWNYEGQQNLGLAATLKPALDRLHGRGSPEAQSALSDSLKPFNTQPYMSGPILGAVVRLMELGDALPPERQERFRMALMTAFAAIGDAFFWNAALPAAAVAGLFWGFRGAICGAVVFLLLFNAAHLTVRIWGYCLGYRQALNIAGSLDRFNLPLAAVRLRVVIAGGLGLLAAWVLHFGPETEWTGAGYLLAALGVGVGILVGRLILRRGLPVEILIYGILGLLLAGTHVF